jgi:hypothetical protein
MIIISIRIFMTVTIKKDPKPATLKVAEAEQRDV